MATNQSIHGQSACSVVVNETCSLPSATFQHLFCNHRSGNKNDYLQVFLDHRPREEVSKLVAAKTNGATPLVLSCRNGHQEVVEYLVDRCSASVEQPGSVTFDGETIEGAPPLWCAAAAGTEIGFLRLIWFEIARNVQKVTS